MRVLITRPVEDATTLADQVQARGHDPIICPVLRIEAVESPLPLLDGIAGVIATSANGMRAFARRTPRRDLPVYAVGATTAEAARKLGFQTVTAAGGDSAALTALVADQAKPEAGPLLWVAGKVTAGDLAVGLKARGFTVEKIVLYDARPAETLPEAGLRALKEGRVDAALFYSAHTAETFTALARAAGVEDALGHVHALCLSQAVADRLPAKFKEVHVVAKPDQAALLDTLDRLAKDRPGTAAGSAAAPAPHSNAPRSNAPGSITPDPPASTSSGAAPSGTPASSRVSGGRVWLAALAGGGIAALATIGTAGIWGPLVLPPQDLDRTSEARLQQIERGLVEARRALEKPPADPALANRLTAIEAGLAEVKTRMNAAAQIQQAQGSASGRPETGRPETGRPEQVEALAARLGVLEEGLRGTADAADLAPVAERAGKLASQMSAYEERVAKAEAQINARARAASRDGAIALATVQLTDAARRGAPFAEPLRILTGVADGDARLTAALAPLIPLADRGAPNMATLAAEFTGLARSVKAADLAAGQQGWMAEVSRLAGHLVTIRRTDRPAGDSLDGRLAAIETALAAGDGAAALPLVTALAEADTSGQAAAIRAFADRLQARLTVDAASATLFDLAVSGLAGSGQ